MKDRIRLSMTDGIAHVRLNRADKMNALDPDMLRLRHARDRRSPH